MNYSLMYAGFQCRFNMPFKVMSSCFQLPMVRKRGTATRSDVDDGETEEPHKLEEKEMRVFAENCNEDDE